MIVGAAVAVLGLAVRASLGDGLAIWLRVGHWVGDLKLERAYQAPDGNDWRWKDDPSREIAWIDSTGCSGIGDAGNLWIQSHSDGAIVGFKDGGIIGVKPMSIRGNEETKIIWVSGGE